MKRTASIILGVFSLLSIPVFGQQRTDEECIRAVADNILKQPVHSL